MKDQSALTAIINGSQFRLQHAGTSKFLFISGDILNGDRLMEARALIDHERSTFVLEDYGEECFKIYNEHTGTYLFLSNDKMGDPADNIVEGRSKSDEPRFAWKFELVDGNQARLYNPTHDKHVFVSNDIINGDNIVEAHTARDDRTLFKIVVLS